MSSPIKRVLIADDHAIIRRGVKALVESLPNLEVIAQASNGREALRLASEAKPDIAILDYSLPKLNGRDLILEVKRESRTTEILVYTMHDRRRSSWMHFELARAPSCSSQTPRRTFLPR
jgi:DNA-binding NarL/FixJ family response regulator